MAQDAFDAQSFLTHQLRPALVLDSNGTVIAANKGSCRLIVPSHTPASKDDKNILLGKTVSDLGLVPLPGDPPVLWTWNEVLRSALQASRSDIINRDKGDHDPNATIDVLQDTDDFWEDEAKRQAIVETDVYVTRHNREPCAPGTVAGPLKSSSMIKARATIYWFPQDDHEKGNFLVTFNRMSLLDVPVPSTMTLLAEPVSHLFGASETPQVFMCRSCGKKFDQSNSYSSSHSEIAPDEPDVASTIIPFMMATLNTDGKVINLSKSWHRFLGLDEAGSLGSGWLASMHPDDVVEGKSQIFGIYLWVY
jgi:hypothetical protein